MDIGCTPFFVTGWKIFYCGWKIGWKIPHSEAYLPAFIVFTVRVLRRFWEIWQIFFAYRVIMHVIASLLFGVLSVFLTIFLAYDDAQVRKIQLLPDFDKMINDVEKEVEEQQAEDGLVNHIPDLKQLSEDIDKTTNTFINVALELESAIQQYQRAEAQLGGAVTTISKKVDTINQHIDKVLENASTKLKVSVNINYADWQKIQELFVKERQWMTAQMQTHIREVNSMFADERKKVAK